MLRRQSSLRRSEWSLLISFGISHAVSRTSSMKHLSRKCKSHYIFISDETLVLFRIVMPIKLSGSCFSNFVIIATWPKEENRFSLAWDRYLFDTKSFVFFSNCKVISFPHGTSSLMMQKKQKKVRILPRTFPILVYRL